MVDPYAALVTYLRATSPLRTLLGGAYVFTPELPGNRAGNLKSVVFRNQGGRTYEYLRAQDLRVGFRCYGSTAAEAQSVYAALYDRLHDANNFIVGTVGFHGATEEVPGVPLEDPTTNWPFWFSVYSIKVATIPVTA